MKAYQRQIREKELAENPPTREQLQLGSTLSSASVHSISSKLAKEIILRYEWLGNMGTTEFAYGLFFGHLLGGVVCFGRTAGTNVRISVCGKRHKDRVITLCRGACLPWAHQHSASFLISEACWQMTKRGYNIFIAYSDPEAGEIGTVYQASNWLYCGMTSSTEKFRTPEGIVKDSRLVSAYARDRRNRKEWEPGEKMRYKRTRAEQKALMISQGFTFFKGTPKHRYVGLYGNRREIRMLKKSLRWPVCSYPKRIEADKVSQEEHLVSSQEGEVRVLVSAPKFEGGQSNGPN